MSFDHDSAARELDLYAENEGALHGQFNSIIANIKRKMKSGKYMPGLAPKLWLYWYDTAAKMYCKEFGGQVKYAFPKALRMELAEARAVDEYHRIKNGEYGVF